MGCLKICYMVFREGKRRERDGEGDEGREIPSSLFERTVCIDGGTAWVVQSMFD